MGSSAELIERLTARPGLDDWHKAWYVAEKERAVTIRRAFYLGKTEVTHEQFKLFVARSRHVTFAEQHGKGWAYHGPEEKWKQEPRASWKLAGEYIPAANHPVTNVGATDAIAFCRWLRAETGSECRLPAESEWEFACRGGRYGLWGHGDDEGKLADFAVYGVDLPTAVGTRKPNGFGLLDMSGNASERCAIEDPWTDDPARSPNLGGAIYPVRGGRFNEVRAPVGVWPDAYRAARRTWEPAADLTAGFRVLREIAS
jgi:formylglycine-generating enzyme required for sulfatase activity